MPLFADAQEPLAYAGLGSLITGIIGTLVWGIIKVMNARHENSEKVQHWADKKVQDIITQLTDRSNKLETRVASLEEAEERCKSDLAEERRLRSIMSQWIEWAQPAMVEAGIRVPQFNLDDSQTHRALPPEGPRR